MNITAQLHEPKTRSNVSSSTPLGSGDDPGCVWHHTRKYRCGESPASTHRSEKSATAISSMATVTGEVRCCTVRKSSTYRRSSFAVMPNPAISVLPAWQKYCSFNHASGENINDVS